MTRAVAMAVAVAVVVAAVAGSAAFGDGRMPMNPGMTMVGNLNDFPDVASASRADLRRARFLRAAAWRVAPRFNTLAKARSLGYQAQRLFRPGISHLRKEHTRFWGRVFDPNAPQALLFWCPTRGACALVAFMYRAPPGKPPSTWGDLLSWHRHGRMGTWMTHVWLTRHTREALATCAPIQALAEARGITPEPYTHGGSSMVMPCSGQMPAMPMG
jgi:hypothetical protein